MKTVKQGFILIFTILLICNPRTSSAARIANKPWNNGSGNELADAIAQTDEADAYYEKGLNAYDRGNYEEAITHFKNVRELDATYKTGSVLNYIGLCYGNTKGWDEALPYYEQAFEADPTEVTYAYNTGLAYYNIGSYQDAIPYLKNAQTLDAAYHTATVLNYLGLCYGNTSGWDEALPYYEKAFEADPTEVVYAYNTGLAYYNIGNYQDAIPYFKNAQALDASYQTASVLNYLGLCYEGSKGWDEALPYYEKAFEVDPTEVVYAYNTGLASYNIEDYQDAILYFKNAEVLDPTYKTASVLNYLGLCYGNTTGWDEALPYYEKASEVDPTEVVYAYNTGLAYYYIENYQDAIPYFKNAQVLDADYHTATVLNYLGLCYGNTKGWDEALPYYENAFEADPTEVAYAYNTGLAYYNIEDYQKAITYFKKVRVVDPTYKTASVLNYLGLCYGNTKGWDDALPYYEKAFEADPTEVVYAYNTGLAYYNTDDYQEAITYFKRTQDLDEDYNKKFVLNYLELSEENLAKGGDVTPSPSSQGQLTDSTPPTILILEPPLTRGLKIAQKVKNILVRGRAIDESGIYDITVNGKETNISPDGDFWSDVRLRVGDNEITVIAEDIHMNVARKSFSILREGAPPSPSVGHTEESFLGKYYALIIGVQDYHDVSVNDLDYPVQDAENVIDVLTTDYTFEKSRVYFLKNPDHKTIIKALSELRGMVTADDNLLIFYAGHGYWDEDIRQGYWLPSNASWGDPSEWLSNSTIRDYVRGIKSKHTLLIADACFSGAIFRVREAFIKPPISVQRTYEMPSRKAITSGAIKTVPDKSVFVEYLIKRLRQNKARYLYSEKLYIDMKDPVINNSPGNQTPLFGVIGEAGDEGGDFIFIHR